VATPELLAKIATPHTLYIPYISFFQFLKLRTVFM